MSEICLVSAFGAGATGASEGSSTAKPFIRAKVSFSSSLMLAVASSLAAAFELSSFKGAILSVAVESSDSATLPKKSASI